MPSANLALHARIHVSAESSPVPRDASVDIEEAAATTKLYDTTWTRCTARGVFYLGARG